MLVVGFKRWSLICINIKFAVFTIRRITVLFNFWWLTFVFHNFAHVADSMAWLITFSVLIKSIPFFFFFLFSFLIELLLDPLDVKVLASATLNES